MPPKAGSKRAAGSGKTPSAGKTPADGGHARIRVLPAISERNQAVWGYPALAIGIGLAGLLSCSVIQDGDVWWHLATGRMILAGGGIPRTDPFTFTAFGRPWVTHEWLSEVLFRILERSGGIGLLVLFKAGLAAAALALSSLAALAGTRSRDRLPAAALGVVLAAPLISLRAFARPHMLTALLLGLLLLLLRLESTDGRRRWRILLVPLFLLWANVHAGFVLGLATTVLYWAGDFLSSERLGRARSGQRRSPESLTSPRWRERGLTLAAALGVTFINPNHIHAHLYALRLIGRSEVRESISELQSVFHPAYRGALFLKALAAAGLAGAALIIASRRRLVWPLLLPALLFAALALASVRGLSEFAVLLPAVFGAHGVPLGVRRRATPAVCAAVILLSFALGAVALVRGIPMGVDPPQRIGLGVEEAGIPAAAARLLKEAPPSGRVFNLLSYGGYLIYAAGPETKVYIDGRLDVFPPGFLSSYNRMMQDGTGWSEAVKQYGITLAVVNYIQESERDRGVRARLREDPDWECILAGDYTLAYARRIPQNEAILRRYGIPFDPSARSRDFIGEFVSRASPADIERAVESLKNMAELAPEEIAPSLFLGQILDGTGRSREAIAPARHAARIDPRSTPIRLFLAGALQRADSVDGARRELASLLEDDSRNVQALSLLALVERSAGHRGEALKLLERAADLDPSDPVVQLRLGVINGESGNLDEAERHLRRALALRPGDPSVLQNLRALEAVRAQVRQ